MGGESTECQSPRPEAPAIIMSGSGETLDYAAFDSRSSALARFLLAQGLCPGDRVALLAENCPDLFVAMWAARRAGLRFVPVNHDLHRDEAAYIVRNSDAKAIVTTQRLRPMAREILAMLPELNMAISAGPDEAGFATIDAIHADDVGTPYAASRQGGPMPYSSGTTGRPKGILRPLADAPFCTPNKFETTYARLYDLGTDTVYLTAAPAYHGIPISWSQAVFVAGGTNVVMERFDAEAALAAIARYRVTHVQFVPTHFVRMLRLPRDVRGRYDLSSLRFVLHGAAPCAPHVKQAMIDWLGPIIHEFYSGSERCGLTFCSSEEWLARPGTVGRSKAGAIHVTDPESGHELPVGEIGLIHFEHPDRFEYHGDAAKTAECFHPAGWGTHGDLGYVDADGYLFLADRRSDLILSGGVNIYPQEIENLLLRHAAVEDVAVVGKPDAEFGERPHAIVQLAAGLVPGDDTAAEILDFCRQNLSGFKQPRSIAFHAKLPRQPNGKLLRRLLREDLRGADLSEQPSIERT